MKSLFRKLQIWRSSKESDREYVRRALHNEFELSRAFMNFMFHAFNHGKRCCITVEVDGVKCITGVFVPAKDPMVEMIANWAAAQKQKKNFHLEEFDRTMDRIEGKQIDSAMRYMMEHGNPRWEEEEDWGQE
jgi:hypothetical protein